MTPTIKGSEKLALSPAFATSRIPKMNAPNVAGRLSKNENFAASDFFYIDACCSKNCRAAS